MNGRLNNPRLHRRCITKRPPKWERQRGQNYRDRDGDTKSVLRYRYRGNAQNKAIKLVMAQRRSLTLNSTLNLAFLHLLLDQAVFLLVAFLGSARYLRTILDHYCPWVVDCT